MGVAAVILIIILLILLHSSPPCTLHATLLTDFDPTLPLHVLNLKMGSGRIVLYRNYIWIHLIAIFGQTL
jgi:hypothetical protein